MTITLARLTSALVALACAATSVRAAPFLALRAASGSATAATVTVGTSLPLSLDVALDTNGMTVNGVQFHATSTAAAARYAAAAPFTVLNNPFVAGDVGASPSAGAALDANASVALFKSSGTDYPAQAGSAIVRLAFDVSKLAKGTYTFTPVFDVFVNATTPDMESGFSPAGAFTLTVASAPEPATLAAIAGAAGVALVRRRRR